MIEENIRKLFLNTPSLKKTLLVLGKNEIRYGIFAGAQVSLLTSIREPTDVDILVADIDFDKLTTLFKGSKITRKKKEAQGEFYYMDKDGSLEFISRLDFIVNGINYPVRLTELAWKNTQKVIVDQVDVIFLNPVDTILEKAIEPRGKEVGKHDLEDIEALLANVEINNKYLVRRAKEMNAGEKVKQVLSKYGLDLSSK